MIENKFSISLPTKRIALISSFKVLVRPSFSLVCIDAVKGRPPSFEG